MFCTVFCIRVIHGSSNSLNTSLRLLSIALVVFSTRTFSPGNISPPLVIAFIFNSVFPRSIDFSSTFSSSFPPPPLSKYSFAKPCLSMIAHFSFAALDTYSIGSFFFSGTYKPIRASSNLSGGISSYTLSSPSLSSSFPSSFKKDEEGK